MPDLLLRPGFPYKTTSAAEAYPEYGWPGRAGTVFDCCLETNPLNSQATAELARPYGTTSQMPRPCPQAKAQST